MGLMKAKTVLLDWDDSDYLDVFKTPKEPAPVVTFKDDPIALSWASYFVWLNRGHRWVDLNDVEAHEHDREMAAMTRKYYRDKFVIDGLRGKPMTPFRTVLYGILCGEPIRKDQVGMLMRLPYFYHEDVTYNEIFSKTVDLPKDQIKKLPQEKTMELKPLVENFVGRKGNEILQYWFTDSDNHAIMLAVKMDNPLRSFIHSMFKKGEVIKLTADFWCKELHYRPGQHFWQLGNPKLA